MTTAGDRLERTHPDEENSSTMHAVKGVEAAKRGRWIRRGFTIVLVAFVGAALLGVYGPSTEVGTTYAKGYEVTVEHGTRLRSGEPAPLRIAVTHPGGFAAPVTLTFDATVFDDLDFQNWYPNPDSENSESGGVVYEYPKPEGNAFEVRLDARVQPQQLGGPFEHWVEVTVGKTPIARVEYSGWLLP